MKTAIFINEGVQQVILTPENKWEDNILNSIKSQENSVEFKMGEFYECQGGYTRFVEEFQTELCHTPKDLILVIRKKDKKETHGKGE